MSSNQNLNTPESIFTVPQNISESDKQDSIHHLLDRIKGTVMTTSHVIGGDSEIPRDSVRDCLLGVYADLEILEKLTGHR